MAPNWMIYGANGYTAALLIERAKAAGHAPVLAGRTAERVRPIAEDLGWPWKAFALDDKAAAAKALSGVAVFANMAGPFSRTARPAVDACLAAGAHYVDITGEYTVFEDVIARHAEAQAAGVTLVSGVGFDVVPSDALAAMLKDALPDAVELELAFGPARGSGRPSRGTMATMVEHIGLGGKARIDGVIRDIPLTWRTPVVPFAHGHRRCITMPWGDVSTAYHTTGIPNVCVYMSASARGFKITDAIKPFLALGPVKKALQFAIRRFVYGPGDDERRAGRVGLWGRVKNASGQSAEMTMETPEGYTLTAATTLGAVERLLAGGVPRGALTPTRAFGTDLIRSVPEVTIGPIVRR